jgi:energy-coupling factor transport system permease protein
MALTDITLGQYYPAESPIHSLDSRTKVLGTFGFLISLFIAKSFTGLLFAGLCLLCVIKLSKVPLRFVTRGLKPVMFLIIFTLIINVFFSAGEHMIWQWGIIKMSRESIHRGGFMAARLVLLIFGSSLLTLTTKPIELTDGLENLLGFLKLFKVSPHELAMMMGIALRFIPTLLEETDKIMKAQTARGANFETGKLMDRAKSLVPLLVPLFVSAFRIAADLAMAMEARCYRGGEGRTRLHALKYGRKDLTAGLLFALYLAAMIVMRRFPLI